MFQRLILLLAGWLFVGALLADGKLVRLRNGIIETPDKPARTAAPAALVADPAVKGLYLVQFTQHIDPAWRSELEGQRVEFLNYIPDDAFVVYLDGVALGSLRALPYVRWVGNYDLRHKLHPRVTAAFARDPGTNLPVKLLVRSGARPEEIALVRLRTTPSHASSSPGYGTIVSGRLTARALAEVAKSPAVLWIEVAPRVKMMDEIATKLVAGDDGQAGTRAVVQSLGFDGTGVTVSVADSGIDFGDPDLMHPDLAGRVDAFLAYGGLPDASDEHSHGTHCAGIVAANAATGEMDDAGFLYGLGVAPGAHLVDQRIFDGNGDYFPPDSNEQLTRDAVRAGAQVGSNSWGDDTQGQYDLNAAEFDALVRDADALTPGDQQYVLEFSAGNAGPGPGTIGSPAVAKNVIATGACENDRLNLGIYTDGSEVMADFSSRGPCEDGRIKPDLTAPGTWISSTKSGAAGEDKAWSPIDEYYLYMGGTSQAGPHASGACAVFIQWYRSRHGGATPSPAMVKAALINSADDMGTAVVFDPENPDDPGTVVGDTGPVPNMDEGWGRINLETLIASDRRTQLTDQATELSAGKAWETRVVVGAADQLKVTMAYTDVPGLPAAIPALVNDLDLEVVSPSGQLYRGNAFLDGESIAGTPRGDSINNVEGVHIAQPEAGEWILRVRAVNVVQDIHRRTNAIPVQDFVLVVSGNLPAPGEGVISFDRDAYRVPSVATIRVVDSGLAGQTTVPVQVSTSSGAGETAILKREAATSTYIGSVQLVAGTAAAGQLKVADGDTLAAVYTDANPAGERRTTAMVDNAPPVIGDVAATAEFGRATVTCTISESASVSLWYGTTNAVTNVVARLGFETQPSLPLPALEPGTTYFYYLVATDRAGNVSTNNNDGHYFRFVGPRAATALLLYAPELIFTDLLAETPYPGPEYWTGALDAVGIDYEIWDTNERGGAPTAEQLKAYRLVLWRPEELQALTPGVTTALSAYVAGGGALFVASFDLLSRLSEANLLGFATDTLHVASETVDQGAASITAVHGDPVGAGVQLDLNYDAFPSGDIIDLLGIVWSDGPDFLQVGTNAAPVFVQESGGIVGLRYPKTGVDAKGRVVFLSVAFEAIPADGTAPNNSATILGNAIGFLVPGLTGASTLALDADAYTVPGVVTVEVADSRRAGSNTVAVAVSTTTAPTARDVTCFETPIKGVFRGQWVLAATNRAAGPSEPARFAAKNGDTVTVNYADAVGRSIATDSRVDTVPPVLSVPTVDAAYNEVLVSWTTDKECDALVRFGESPGDDSFLTRSAYVAERGTDHQVLVTGLFPDRVYYYQIVSRDTAGNTGTDGNGGKLYQWRTLKPLLPPWTDDLEAGHEGWAVYDDSGSAGIGGGVGDGEGDGTLTGTNWAYGTPTNSHGVQAHSGSNCWGSNLGGDVVEFAITDLISPAVSLVGGNKATLRFWQNFDFTTTSTGDDDFGDLTIEAAQLDVSADDGATWNALYANQTEASNDWEQIELDLGKYLGKVVRFRFNYQLFAFTPSDRLGWLIDDVSVDMVVAPATGLAVSNNLSQASFTLRLDAGTNSYKGAGLSWRTNVPPGTYTVTWDAVPYYTVPSPQTNVLGNSTNVPVFTGTYRFPDANGNGISDIWETTFFGKLLATPPAADADGDGASDLAEFLAGTDPRLPESVLRVAVPRELPNRTVRLEWPTTAGRQYVLEGSDDLRTWQAYSVPARGDGTTMGVTLPALDPRLTYLFRVRAVP